MCFFVFAHGVTFCVFLCICARSEMSFENFGFLREDFLKFRGPPKRLRIIIIILFFEIFGFLRKKINEKYFSVVLIGFRRL